MNDTLKFRGYTGSLVFSNDDQVFHGKVLGISDLVTFEGRSIDELKGAFEEAVADYEETLVDLQR